MAPKGSASAEAGSATSSTTSSKIFSGGQRGGSRAERGNDLQYNLELTFEESVYGKEAKLKIPRWEACADCKGTGAKSAASIKTCPAAKGRDRCGSSKDSSASAVPAANAKGQDRSSPNPVPPARAVNAPIGSEPSPCNIPAGIEIGHAPAPLERRGARSLNGGPPGDLYVAITVKPHPMFHAQGYDILCDVPMQFVTAVLGGKVEVPTLKGNTVIKIPAGHASRIRPCASKAWAFPASRDNRPATNYIVKVQIPTKLTARQKELLKEFAKESGMSMEKDGDGFFDKMKTFFE